MVSSQILIVSFNNVIANSLHNLFDNRLYKKSTVIPSKLRWDLCRMVEPARRYSNPEDHRAAGLCRPQNCRIKQKSPGGCGALLVYHVFAGCCDRAAGSQEYESRHADQGDHATPRIFLILLRTSAGSRPEPFTLPAISSASTSAGSGSGGFDATPRMVQ